MISLEDRCVAIQRSIGASSSAWSKIAGAAERRDKTWVFHDVDVGPGRADLEFRQDSPSRDDALSLVLGLLDPVL